MIHELWQRYASQPFEFSVFDCVIFTAQSVDSYYGTAYESVVRERFTYRSNLQAARLVRNAGGLEPLVRQVLGEPLPAAHLDTYDVGIGHIPGMRVEFVGLIVPNGIMTAWKQGLVTLPRHCVVKGWHVEAKA